MAPASCAKTLDINFQFLIDNIKEVERDIPRAYNIG